jgi:hypothetical protein
MLENGLRLTALTESIGQNQVVNDTCLNDYSSLRWEFLLTPRGLKKP